MRISAHKHDSDYDPFHYQYEVFLNGKKLDRCYCADEEGEES